MVNGVGLRPQFSSGAENVSINKYQISTATKPYTEIIYLWFKLHLQQPKFHTHKKKTTQTPHKITHIIRRKKKQTNEEM